MKTIAREICNNISHFLKEKNIYSNLRGYYYSIIHLFFQFLLMIIVLFNNNIAHLCVILFIVGGDTILNVIFHGCPLTLLEKKYYSNKESISSKIKKSLRKSRIFHKCNHEYETIFELLVNFCTAISLKICILILYQMYKTGLVPYKIQ